MARLETTKVTKVTKKTLIRKFSRQHVAAATIALVVAALASVDGRQAADVASLPVCAGTSAAPMSGWREDRFEDVSVRLPTNFRAVEPQPITDHGGKAWTNGRLGASLTKGYYGLESFDFLQGSRCRVTTADGRIRLVMTDIRPGYVWTMVWDPSIRSSGFFNVIASATGTTEADLPTLRSIVLSIDRRPN